MRGTGGGVSDMDTISTEKGSRQGFHGTLACRLHPVVQGNPSLPIACKVPLCCVPTSQEFVMDKKPSTFLLVAGTWCGGWCWDFVAERLRAAGHRVLTPSFSGVADRSHLLTDQLTLEDHVMDLINIFKYNELRDVILVGHSYAGFPITCALDRLPRKAIKHILYIDGLLPLSGESGVSMMTEEDSKRFFCGSLRPGSLAIPVPLVPAGRFPDPNVQAWFQRLMTPHPVRTYQDCACLANEPGNGFPTTFVACSHTKISALLLSRKRAEAKADWKKIYIESGHNAHILHPDMISDILLSLC